MKAFKLRTSKYKEDSFFRIYMLWNFVKKDFIKNYENWIDLWEFQSSEFFFKKIPKNQIFLYLVPVSSQKYGRMFYNYVFHLWLNSQILA